MLRHGNSVVSCETRWNGSPTRSKALLRRKERTYIFPTLPVVILSTHFNFFLTIAVEIYGVRSLFRNHREKITGDKMTYHLRQHSAILPMWEEEISLLKTIINFWNAESDEFPNLKIGILGRIFEEELVEVEKKRRKTITKRKPVLGSQGWKKTTSKKQILADAEANDAKL